MYFTNVLMRNVKEEGIDNAECDLTCSNNNCLVVNFMDLMRRFRWVIVPVAIAIWKVNLIPIW